MMQLAWKGIADGAAGFTFASVVSGQNALAVAASIVAAGSIVIPRCLDWWGQWKERERVEHARDIAAETIRLQEEVIHRVQAEALARELADKLKAALACRCPFSTEEGAKCKPGEHPPESAE